MPREVSRVEKRARRLAATPSPDELSKLAARTAVEPVGAFAVDGRGLTWGRDVLHDAARAGARAGWHHAMSVDAFDRDRDLRAALVDAIDAISRVKALANLLTDLNETGARYAREAQQILSLPVIPANGKGSPGRPVHDAVREVVDARWSMETGRALPRRVEDRHSDLVDLRRAVAKDIFGNRNALGPGRRPANISGA